MKIDAYFSFTEPDRLLPEFIKMNSTKIRHCAATLLLILCALGVQGQTFSKETLDCKKVPQEMNNLVNDSVTLNCTCFRFGQFVYGVEYSVYGNRMVTTYDISNATAETFSITSREELLRIIPETISDLEGLGGKITRAYTQSNNTIFEMSVYGEMRIITLESKDNDLKVQVLD
jgi:hypothetical protein